MLHTHVGWESHTLDLAGGIFFAFLQEQIGNRFVPDLEGWLEPVLLFLKPTNRLLNGARV